MCTTSALVSASSSLSIGDEPPDDDEYDIEFLRLRDVCFPDFVLNEEFEEFEVNELCGIPAETTTFVPNCTDALHAERSLRDSFLDVPDCSDDVNDDP